MLAIGSVYNLISPILPSALCAGLGCRADERQCPRPGCHNLQCAGLSTYSIHYGHPPKRSLSRCRVATEIGPANSAVYNKLKKQS